MSDLSKAKKEIARLRSELRCIINAWVNREIEKRNCYWTSAYEYDDFLLHCEKVRKEMLYGKKPKAKS